MVKKFSICLSLFLLTHCLTLYGQNSNVPLGKDYFHLLDRYEIRSGKFSKQFHSSFKPVQGKAVAAFAAALKDSIARQSWVDLFNLQFLGDDTREWDTTRAYPKPALRLFYQEKPDLVRVNHPNLDLHINPVLALQSGKEAQERNPYLISHGVELRGSLNRTLGFYAFLTKSHARLPSYVRPRIAESGVLPGERYWSAHENDGAEFLSARAHLSFNATRHINFQFGQDRFFIGNGARSMILSDFGASYPFFKIQTQVWRFSYTNLFAQLRGHFPRGGYSAGRDNFPKKFFALHHLSLNVTDNFNIGLFEAIVSGDSVLGGFALEYLNPVIFYRAVEHNVNNSRTGNAMLGMDAKWNIGKHFQLYGQFVLDEFLLQHLRESTGWWANKWAYQLGLKYIDALAINNLDLQFEWNRARPFIYSHQTEYTSYTHYSQPLAHPLGANFDEQLFILRYQPLKRLNLKAQYLQANYGADSLGISFGGNVLRSYNDRAATFGHFIGQGVPTKLRMAQVTASYMLAHRLFIDLSHTYRVLTQEAHEAKQNNVLFTAGLRWNIARREHLF